VPHHCPFGRFTKRRCSSEHLSGSKNASDRQGRDWVLIGRTSLRTFPNSQGVRQHLGCCGELRARSHRRFVHIMKVVRNRGFATNRRGLEGERRKCAGEFSSQRAARRSSGTYRYTATTRSLGPYPAIRKVGWGWLETVVARRKGAPRLARSNTSFDYALDY